VSIVRDGDALIDVERFERRWAGEVHESETARRRDFIARVLASNGTSFGLATQLSGLWSRNLRPAPTQQIDNAMARFETRGPSGRPG
jgi:hypothetical protein